WRFRLMESESVFGRSDPTITCVEQGRRAGVKAANAARLSRASPSRASIYERRTSRSHPSNLGAGERSLLEISRHPPSPVAGSGTFLRHVGSIDEANTGGFCKAKELFEAWRRRAQGNAPRRDGHRSGPDA